jgi:hypothetical protein
LPCELEIAGQFGSPEATDSVVPVFMKAMKPAGVESQIHSLDDRIRQLSLLLRVSGRFQSFEGKSVENVKFARDRSWISVDLLLWVVDWQDRTKVEVARVLAERVRGVPAVIEPLLVKRGMMIDRSLLNEELGRFAERFVELAESLESA